MVYCEKENPEKKFKSSKERYSRKYSAGKQVSPLKAIASNISFMTKSFI